MSLSCAEFPTSVLPQLSTITDYPPDGPDWLHEIKLDGFRLLIRKNGREVSFFTRNGHDWSGRFPAVAEAVRKLPPRRVWLDGELVVFKEDGRSCFGSLQRAVAKLDQDALAFCGFDVVHLEHRDLCDHPLEKRKELLKDILGPGAWNLRYVDHIEGNGPAFFDVACDHHIEGIVSKKMGSPYRPGARTQTWLKTKWRGYNAVRQVAWPWWERNQ